MIEKGYLRAERACPYAAVDIALRFYGLQDARASRLEVQAKLRMAAQRFRHALRKSKNDLSEGFRRANALVNKPGDMWEMDFRDVLDEPWRSAARIEQELEAIVPLATAEASEKPGARGYTAQQSLIEGFLLAWEKSNGRLPDPSNKRFHRHLAAAFELLFPDADIPADEGLIRSVRDRLKEARDKFEQKYRGT